MTGIKNNQRSRCTKEVIRSSFLKLLRIEDIEAINVTDICKEAEITRGTFYHYYSSQFDLQRCLRKDLFKNTLVLIKLRFSQGQRTVLPAIFEALKQADPEIVKAALDANQGSLFLRRIFASCKEIVRPYMMNQIDWVNDQQFEYLYAYFSNGVTGVILLWVEQGMRPVTSYIEEDTLKMIRESITYLANHKHKKRGFKE
ncbi:TetR/AcrR family transcriptional regulator [Liquorilactobacillus oeni]|uniref:Transcription regulator n=1 Tax=Liquorilactobacillus oeni DSM 19972 TaxID=1423777 RepID=A0A0R1MD38_9LACO|nr:TetR/AcrR family transcriptional regulator [Liquorilactobacillus oeni]KRL05910.1 transcription regulator [Liquorilactobacillus oeni DSM 19972]